MLQYDFGVKYLNARLQFDRFVKIKLLKQE